MKKLGLPYGVQDYLPQECYKKQGLENKLGEVFFSAGYDRAETAALEYSDVSSIAGLKKTFNFTDSDGSLLSLRSDYTSQIRRIAQKLGEEPCRLYYIGNSYEFLPDLMGASARTREFSQAGIELFGDTEANGDVEVVLLAIEALLKSGLDDFLIDLGHMGFFNGLANEADLDDEVKNELIRLISGKDSAGIDAVFRGLGAKCSKNTADTFKALSSLYGGEEVLSAAQKLTENKYAVNAVKSLTYIYNAVKTAGFEKYITLDFGLLKGGYYTGLVIKGITSDYGATILDGGRYDGEGSGAVGFAIGTKRLLSALESRSNALESLRPCDYAYINLNGFSDTEFKTIQELRISGKRAVKLFFGDKSELLAYCKKSKIKNAIIFDGERAEEIEIDQR